MASVFQGVLAIMLVINAANGLKCYSCNSEDSVQCKWSFASISYSTQECTSAGILDNLFSPKCFKISAQSKDGKEYIARGCLPPATIGCSAMAKTIGWIASSTSNDGGSLENLSCETCETDKCNSANRLAAFTFVGLLLSAFAFLL